MRFLLILSFLIFHAWAQASGIRTKAEIKEFLEVKKQNINKKDQYSYGLLHYAVFKKDTKEMKYLIQKGIDVSQTDFMKNTPLHDAISLSFFPGVRLLVKSGADLNAKNQFGHSPLYIAVSKKNEKVVNLLIKHGADVNVKNNHGEDLIFRALESGSYPIVHSLMKTRKINPDLVHPDGDSAFHYSLYSGNSDIVQIFLNRKNVSSKNIYGETPLFISSLKGDTNSVKLIIDHGIDFDTRDEFHRTPYYYTSNRHYELHSFFQKLIELREKERQD